MSTSVFVAALGAAIPHANWSALVKDGANKRVAMGAVVIGRTPLALLAGLSVPLPAQASLSSIHTT